MRRRQAIAFGAVAGLLSTTPMTALMLRGHRHLPHWQRYKLPPRIITDRLLGHSNYAHGRSKSDRWKAARAIAAHFAFGAVCGAGYPEFRRLTAGSVLSGPIYGIAIWAGSYLGWVPATDAMAPAVRQPRERVLLMVTAHIVWGTSLGLLQNALEKCRMYKSN